MKARVVRWLLRHEPAITWAVLMCTILAVLW